MAWAYVPGLGALSSDLHPSFQVTAPLLLWRGRPMPPPALSRAWNKGGWIRRLSGLTCEPSTASRGVAQWISSLRATRANLSASPATAKAPTIPGISGHTSHASSENASQLSLFSKTSPDTSAWVWNPSQQTFAQWVTAFKRESLARHNAALRTFASDYSSLLPTPAASSYGSNQGGVAGRSGKVRHSLESMARQGLIPTPTVKGNYNRKGLSPASGDGLATWAAKTCGPGLLNPRFVAWMMGFQTDWTDLEP